MTVSCDSTPAISYHCLVNNKGVDCSCHDERGPRAVLKSTIAPHQQMLHWRLETVLITWKTPFSQNPSIKSAPIGLIIIEIQ